MRRWSPPKGGTRSCEAAASGAVGGGQLELERVLRS
jgi:hypothetical protein